MVTGKVQNVGECLSRLYFRCVSDRVRSVSPELLNHLFFTKLGMMVYFNKVMCLVEKLVHYLQCQGEGLYIIKILVFSLYLLNCCSVCYQTYLIVQPFKP